MNYLIHHQYSGHEVISRPTTADLAVQVAVTLAAAGRHVTVTDEGGRPVDLEALAEEVRQAGRLDGGFQL